MSVKEEALKAIEEEMYYAEKEGKPEAYEALSRAAIRVEGSGAERASG